MVKYNKVTKKEFIMAMAIIIFCITLYTMLHPPVLETTIHVKIEPIYELKCDTGKNGDVNCYVKK